MENKKKSLVAIFANEDTDIYGFRLEILEAIQDAGYQILISCPYGEKLEKIKSNIQFEYDNPKIDRRGTNLISDGKLFFHYCRVIKKYKPDIAVMFTIKPNVYAGMVCSIFRVPYIGAITGLGTSIENGGILKKISLTLYKFGLRKAKYVFFQNSHNLNLMIKQKVVKEEKCKLVPGSGVNVDKFVYEKYPEENQPLKFVTIGRIMKDKGINEILEAARIVKSKYPEVVFQLIGYFDENYEKQVYRACEEKIVEYLGVKQDVRPYYKACNAIVHASYHEGMSNVLLEAAATGRPVIATDVPGCIETYEPDITGFSCKAKDAGSLSDSIIRFIELPYDDKVVMGEQGRKRVEKIFDRKIVVTRYIDAIKKILEGK